MVQPKVKKLLYTPPRLGKCDPICPHVSRAPGPPIILNFSFLFFSFYRAGAVPRRGDLVLVLYVLTLPINRIKGSSAYSCACFSHIPVLFDRFIHCHAYLYRLKSASCIYTCIICITLYLYTVISLPRLPGSRRYSVSKCCLWSGPPAPACRYS